jgi:hypothetical protein
VGKVPVFRYVSIFYLESEVDYKKITKFFAIQGAIFIKNIAFFLRSDIIKSNLVLLAGQG